MPVYLVRHGSAGVRNDFDAKDSERSLDDVGKRQAKQLSDWLQLESISSIHSSPFPRCTETVAPLAQAVGLNVQLHDDLQEGADIDAAWEIFERVSDSNAVICSHGDLIPEILERAYRRGTVFPTKVGFAKGSVWILNHWNGTTFATAVYTQIQINTFS